MKIYCVTPDAFEELCPCCVLRDSFCGVGIFIIGAVEQIEQVFKLLNLSLEQLYCSCAIFVEAQLYSLGLVFPLLFSWMRPINLSKRPIVSLGY